MTGTLINAAAIIVGASIGFLLKKGIPERFKITVIQGLSLAVIVIGLQMALKTNNILIMIFSLVLGGLTGELLNIEGRLEAFGSKIETLLGNQGGSFTKAFVTPSLVYCVGAMAIVGSIQEGISGDPGILLLKSVLDGVSAIIFASTLGLGVAFSALPVLIYQGSISLLAQYLQDVLTPSVITEMTTTGGVLIMAIGLRILEIKDIKVGNLLPAIGYSLLLAAFIPDSWF
ncbi:MAG: DUF554 domain-containing protein [Thermincola sp.]|nr:DUF554 domain-containing protein [Thermincola sp.]MDT3702917.1 DUF554 domain-containing protein [Thermincola sp.]